MPQTEGSLLARDMLTGQRRFQLQSLGVEALTRSNNIEHVLRVYDSDVIHRFVKYYSIL